MQDADYSAADLVRYEAKVDRSGACHEWTSATCHFGHGQFKLNGRAWKAHRLAWIFANGPIPDGLCVLHRCDNPPCVKVEHLFVGTQGDNMDDMRSKGRAVVLSGESSPRAKLTSPQVAEIRALEGQRRQIDVAEAYGVTVWTVRRIWRGTSRTSG